MKQQIERAIKALGIQINSNDSYHFMKAVEVMIISLNKVINNLVGEKMENALLNNTMYKVLQKYVQYFSYYYSMSFNKNLLNKTLVMEDLRAACYTYTEHSYKSTWQEQVLNAALYCIAGNVHYPKWKECTGHAMLELVDRFRGFKNILSNSVGSTRYHKDGIAWFIPIGNTYYNEIFVYTKVYNDFSEEVGIYLNKEDKYLPCKITEVEEKIEKYFSAKHKERFEAIRELQNKADSMGLIPMSVYGHPLAEMQDGSLRMFVEFRSVASYIEKRGDKIFLYEDYGSPMGYFEKEV